MALNVYLAMCYYKLDYFDVAMELLGPYLKEHGDSVIANNLKACAVYRMYDGKTAEQVSIPVTLGLIVVQTLRQSLDISNLDHMYGAEMLRHNLVVFRNGDGALQILPKLVEAMPEARLNLAIYYLRQNEPLEAMKLMKDFDPALPVEYILIGVVNAALGDENSLKTAQQLFQMVGASPTEADTIPGRQCMASCFILQKSFSDALLYLDSIQPYMGDSDAFHWNFALAKAAVGDWVTAESELLAIRDEKMKADYIYLSHLARCCIRHNILLILCDVA